MVYAPGMVAVTYGSTATVIEWGPSYVRISSTDSTNATTPTATVYRITTDIQTSRREAPNGATIEVFSAPPSHMAKERARILGAIWSRQAISLAAIRERRLEVPLREKAPRRHRALECRRYVRPVHKARVCSSASRYRVLM
jgi:hypothetical protein